MSKPLKPRRGTTTEHAAFIGLAHEVTYDTDKHTLVMHDGVTPGGFPLQRADLQNAKDAAQDEEVANLETALRDLIADVGGEVDAAKNSVPTGTVIAFAANSEPPGGYLLCNGAAVSRTTYAALFAEVGTTCGSGDGSTTFNIPDMTDRFIQGSGTAGTVKAAGLPNITGGVGGGLYTGYNAWGVGYHSNSLLPYESGTYKDTGAESINLDASRVNTIYGASNTVQPPALTMRYYIKY